MKRGDGRHPRLDRRGRARPRHAWYHWRLVLVVVGVATALLLFVVWMATRQETDGRGSHGGGQQALCVDGDAPAARALGCGRRG